MPGGVTALSSTTATSWGVGTCSGVRVDLAGVVGVGVGVGVDAGLGVRDEDRVGVAGTSFVASSEPGGEVAAPGVPVDTTVELGAQATKQTVRNARNPWTGYFKYSHNEFSTHPLTLTTPPTPTEISVLQQKGQQHFKQTFPPPAAGSMYPWPGTFTLPEGWGLFSAALRVTAPSAVTPAAIWPQVRHSTMKGQFQPSAPPPMLSCRLMTQGLGPISIRRECEVPGQRVTTSL